MINLPTVSSGYSEHCRRGARRIEARSGAGRKSGEAEGSGERALQKNDGAKRSAKRAVGLQKLVAVQIGFFAVHAPLTCSVRLITKLLYHIINI